MAKFDLEINFSSEEIECGCGCGLDNISLKLIMKLQVIRWLTKKSIKITSGVRCAKHNAAVGGAPESEHVPTATRPGEAVDIECTDSRMRMTIVFLARIMGMRVGDGPGFLHLGIRSTKAQGVLWNYYDVK